MICWFCGVCFVFGFGYGWFLFSVASFMFVDFDFVFDLVGFWQFDLLFCFRWWFFGLFLVTWFVSRVWVNGLFCLCWDVWWDGCVYCGCDCVVVARFVCFVIVLLVLFDCCCDSFAYWVWYGLTCLFVVVYVGYSLWFGCLFDCWCWLV